MFKYRITTDAWSGYEIQWRFILSPFWMSNYKTFHTAKDAEEYYNKMFNKKTIKYL